MPTKPVPTEKLQEAINLVEKYGSTHYASKVTGISETTLRGRFKAAQLQGFKPTEFREKKKPRLMEKLGRTHMVIPDIQAKHGVPDDHLEWIANYALDKRPDVIVQIGDWCDLESLSMYDKGTLDAEGRRYIKDITAGNHSLGRFEDVIEQHNREHPDDKYKPRKVLTLGNHEERILRELQRSPIWAGAFSFDDFDFKKRGWECHDFLKIVNIDGIAYSHYFISGSMGKPVSSAAALLRVRMGSATMGHTQYYDAAVHKQTQHRALFCGVCYLHDEKYLTVQGNNVRRQIIMKNEVDGEGHYDLCEVSLRFLKKRYS